jgi:endogenous inhibitor of DNA gyrase (YacG/DUF329 family)
MPTSLLCSSCGYGAGECSCDPAEFDPHPPTRTCRACGEGYCACDEHSEHAPYCSAKCEGVAELPPWQVDAQGSTAHLFGAGQ